jgi:hypothetical protein
MANSATSAATPIDQSAPMVPPEKPCACQWSEPKA